MYASVKLHDYVEPQKEFGIVIIIDLNAWFSDNDTERRNSKVSQDGENIIYPDNDYVVRT